MRSNRVDAAFCGSKSLLEFFRPVGPLKVIADGVCTELPPPPFLLSLDVFKVSYEGPLNVFHLREYEAYLRKVPLSGSRIFPSSLESSFVFFPSPSRAPPLLL